jgi:hypothetical protein
VAGSDDDAVGLRILARLPGIEAEDRVGDRWSRGEAVTFVDERGDLGCGEHLEDREECGFTECVSVTAEEDRPANAFVSAEVDDRRGDGRDVRLVEGAVEARTAMAGGPEAHCLRRHRGVGNQVVIGVEKGRDVNEILVLGQLAGACCHSST